MKCSPHLSWTSLFLVCRACPVPVVLLVMLDPVEPLEMLAAPVRLAQLVSE